MARSLRLAAMGLVALTLTAGSALGANSPGLPDEGQTANGVLQLLPTGINPLLTDKAVTDDQLAVAGVWVDSIPTLVSDPNALVVDDDRAQCPDAQFQTINSAVAAALPGARIRVCPGLYKESVPIAKPGLFLQAPRHQGQATECKSPIVNDPTQYAILSYNAALNGGNPSEGFDVEAAGVTIEGFTIQPDPTLVTHDGVGIFTSPLFGGYDIRHNVLQNNSIGVYVDSDGSAATYVRENCLRGNNLSGAAGGNGVYSDQGLSNAAITNNYFTGHTNASVVIDTFRSTPHDIQVTHNESVNDSSIVVADSNDVIINYNKITNPAGSGIVTFLTQRGEISYNNVAGGPDSFNGISLHFTVGATVKSNKVTGFELDGIRIGDESDNNTVASNRSEDNKEAGLQAIEESSNNTIRENHMRGNVPDCSDDTVGGGTAGTANFWINDFGYTEDHPGICKHAAP